MMRFKQDELEQFFDFISSFVEDGRFAECGPFEVTRRLRDNYSINQDEADAVMVLYLSEQRIHRRR